ncbi:cytochrome c [Zoogloea sp.]|jgi:cytochrome c553|uniref:c-type cytochrome n=1 Tax=Zoogloea sp. TaxID=49181 RepID=UPI0035B0BA5A
MIKRSLLLSLLLATGVVQAQDKAAAQPDLAKAKQTAEQVCGACHGADGNSQIPANPKLAGQHAEYLFKQLTNFKSEGGKPAERANAVMGGMVAALSADDMKGLAAHFAGQKLKPEAAKDKSSIELGQRLWRAGDLKRGIPACAACHGPAGAGLPAQYPRLAGQFADYTEAQLKAFRAGERANDPAKMMRTIAVKMTDPEIKAVADYAAGLR